MRTRGLALVIFLTTSAAMAEPLTDIKIVNDRAPDCSSLESIVESVTRGCQTDDERVIALYNFGRYAYYHHAYPGERSGVSALKMINVYGWSLCGGQHTVLAALWEAAGYRWRYRGWSNPGHTTVEVFYGGRWHYLDTFLKFYAWMPDPDSPGGRTIAGQEDLVRDPTLITEAFVHDQPRNVLYQRDNRLDYYGEKVNWTAPAFLVCGDGLEGVLSGVRSSRDSGSPRGWASIRFDGDDYSTAVDLPAGFRLELDWDTLGANSFYFNGGDRAPGHSCGDKDYRNCPAIGPLLEPYAGVHPQRSWSNGRLIYEPHMGSDAFLSDLETVENAVSKDGELRQVDSSKPGVIVVKMGSPYIVVWAVSNVASDDARVEVSADLEKWTPVTPVDFTETVAGTYCYYVRVTFQRPVTKISLVCLVQHNQEALPYLAPGRNRITVTSSDPKSLGDNRLVITYVYCPGSRGRSPEEMFDRDEEVARAHSAEWSSTPVVVQETIEKFPATFEILVPTPEGRYPVYPRMYSLIREVLAPGEEPLDVYPPTTPTVGPGETLAELPNPWRIGVTRPPKQPERETKTVVVPASKTSYVSKSGDVFEHHFIKWLKDDSEAWVLLVDFEPDELPAMADLASAKIVFRAIESHASAPMQAAVVRLNEEFTPGESFDFSGLGKTLGWATVARGDGPGAPFAEPRRYEIHITREVRAWIRGEPSHGMALRIVPNRGIDDGWTVRFTPPQRQPVELEISTYAQ